MTPGELQSQNSPQVAELLAQMHDIQAPADVGWWPLAPGWWFLGFCVLAGAAVAVNCFVKKRAKAAYRKEALKALEAISPQDNAKYATEVSSLLKRVAFTAHPNQRAEIVKACGSTWVQWLNDHSPDKSFAGSSSQALTEGMYQQNANINAKALKESAQRWIKHHV